MFEVWLMLFVVLLVVEIVTVNMVSVWFAAGALITALLSLLIESTAVQIAIFVISSALCLILTQPIVKKITKGKITRTNLDRVIGKIGIVTETITKLEPGEVKVDGKRWSALSDKKIEVGRNVEILSIDGVKLHVKEIKEVKEEN